MASWSDFARDWISYDAYRFDARGVGRPYLLRAIYFASLIAVFMAGIFSIAAPLNLGEYHINNRPLSGREFLANGGWLILPAMAIIGSLLARDLHFGRPRARLVLLGLWAAGLLAWRSTMPDAAATLAQYLLIGLVAWWYLFRKSTSRAYFSDPRGADSGSSAA